MNGMKSGLVIGACAVVMMLGLMVTTARAEDDWTKIATLTAGGDAKEVSVNKEISQCKIKCTVEPVIINTFVVREGGKKTPIRVAARFTKDQEHVIDLGGKKNVTGFRISDDNRGTYEVFVR